ncbi:hypothetical protein [Polyangium sp. y55x31]|uniref:hypothetical protein n=1 Tax=Polyangium sp. y55x31 TaxID=3042688 RepID=UPI002482DA8C|nr:hypothetical protein [Polyangium sp. y55x31]MDI1478089.1 hypothetical protein [Polyangium sp. y55x31]
MWALGIGVLVVGVVVFGGGCSEDKCRNPKIIPGKVGRNQGEGPAVKCNAVVTCTRNGGLPPTVEVLKDVEDPQVVEQGSWTENRCKEALLTRKRIGPGTDCTAQFSPALICLDVDAAAGGPGPSPTGETFITMGVGVSVGAGSGDYWSDAQGAGGAGSAEAYPGDEGQGGI